MERTTPNLGSTLAFCQRADRPCTVESPKRHMFLEPLRLPGGVEEIRPALREPRGSPIPALRSVNGGLQHRLLRAPWTGRSSRFQPHWKNAKVELSTRVLALLVATAFSVVWSARAQAQDAVIADFKQNCFSCHTIGGGRITGPDLKNVEERKDRAWLTRFVMDPQGVLSSGDPYALKLQQEARGTVMPNLAGMTRERAEALLDLVVAESKLEKSQFVGVQISARPLTPQDVERGASIFRGTTVLANGGAPCISCHVTTELGGLGGGRLGPDLTKIFERREGRKGLVAWLSAPATPIMQATFKGRDFEENEILGLVAYFRETAKLDEVSHTTSTLIFALLGIAGAIGVLVVFNAIWGYRFTAVRKPLIEKQSVGDPA